MDLAVIGMGRMGQALVRRLIDSGHRVTIWNRSPDKAAELVELGAKEVRSIGEAVAAASLTITTLTNDEAVKKVALGDGGVRSALPDGSTYVDSSTVSPSMSEELGAIFPRFVAMPILGSPDQVASGQATYLIGAERGKAEALDPLFPGLSGKRLNYEHPATAAAAKLTVNLLLLDGVVALAEAFAGGRAGGLSDDQLRELLGNSPMVAPGLKYRFEGILTGEQKTLWTTALGAKDAGLAVALANSAGRQLPLTATALEQYQKAAVQGDEADIASVSELYRQ
jgi:3-hydroxyisobutyrate dehydrogenase-like beta-hydroxyacid dehydrogenase